jgi:tetratricopeptide (TPR) repeat protein
VPSAERLAELAPQAGHLVHMPSHIFWRVGRYADAIEWNERASAVDESYFAWCRAGSQGLYRALYYPHNVHFLWAAAMAEGRAELALTTARKVTAQVPENLLTLFPPMEEWLALPTVTLLRFGRFDAVLAVPRPPASHGYETGIWHYARALAQVRLGAGAKAVEERGALAALAAKTELEALDFNGESAAKYLRLALHHLDGEIAAARGDFGVAERELRAAVAIQDSFRYTEPPRWFFPIRQALGQVLFDAGRFADAEAVYRDDLEQHPRLGWSLYGLARSLRAQGRESEAAEAEKGFESAWEHADVTLTASRF